MKSWKSSSRSRKKSMAKETKKAKAAREEATTQALLDEQFTRAWEQDNKEPPLDCLGRKKKEVIVEEDQTRRVTVKMDYVTKMPELWLNVFVFGPPSEAGPFAQLFARAKCYKADTPAEADVVVFVGGEDVDPALYGRIPHPRTAFSRGRDDADIKLYSYCVKRGVPMLGVCRGAQFLHVMQGGELYQHVDNHNSSHQIYDLREKTYVPNVSSVHHQMVVRNNKMEVLATASASRERWKDNTEKETGMNADIEAFFYRDTCVIGIQGHPEYQGYNSFTVWSLQLLDRLLNENQDLKYIDNGTSSNRLRIKEELVNAREAGNKALTVIPSEDMIIVEKVK
jgi:gamma-glutamyl-gamma-aminobutyrate hydrolase PuuD